jgi:hypothetical protein
MHAVEQYMHVQYDVRATFQQFSACFKISGIYIMHAHFFVCPLSLSHVLKHV